MSRSHILLVVLTTLFITALVVADIIGSKLIALGPFSFSLAGQVFFNIFCYFVRRDYSFSADVCTY